MLQSIDNNRELILNYFISSNHSYCQVMVLNVSSLLKTVKAVEDEHTRGTRAMEATVEAISQEIRVRNVMSVFFFLK